MSTFAYFKKIFLMNSHEVAEMRTLMLNCAAAHGRSLDAMYIDEIETAPRQLYACLMDSWAHDDKVLIVPSLLHLTGEGDPRALRTHLESGGFVVLIAQCQQPGAGSQSVVSERG